MNTKNNKRRRESQNKIEKAFVNMLLTKSINKISVTDICKETKLNRTTFYANYIDMYDLADKIRINIENCFDKAFKDKENHNALTLFRLIYENQTMFKILRGIRFRCSSFSKLARIKLELRISFSSYIIPIDCCSY